MTLWITHGYMLRILERNLKKCKVLGSLPVFFEFWLQFLSSNARRDLLRVLFVEKGEAVYCPGLFWALCCSYSILEVVYPDAAPWEQREHMWHILEKKTSKLLSFGFLACFCSSFGCSFCHPMQEEAFWECYLLRKVRQFTAQGCFESYFVLIQFWKSFIPTPLHGNNESIHILEKTSKCLGGSLPARRKFVSSVLPSWDPRLMTVSGLARSLKL